MYILHSINHVFGLGSVLNASDHSHSPSAIEVEKKKAITAMKRKARNTDETSGCIVTGVLGKVSRGAAATMPRIYELVDIVTRTRKKTNPQPKIPTSRIEIILEGNNLETQSGNC